MLLLTCSRLYWLWDLFLFFLLYNLWFSFFSFILVAICLLYLFFIFFIDIFFRVRIISTCRLFYSRLSFCSCSSCWWMLIFIIFMISDRGFPMCSFRIMCFWVMRFISRMLVFLMARLRSNYFFLFTFILFFWFCLFSIFALLNWTGFNLGNNWFNVLLFLLYLFFLFLFLLFLLLLFLFGLSMRLLLCFFLFLLFFFLFLLFLFFFLLFYCFWFSFSAFNICFISPWRILHSCWVFFINLRGFWYYFWISGLGCGRSFTSSGSWRVCRIGFSSWLFFPWSWSFLYLWLTFSWLFPLRMLTMIRFFFLIIFLCLRVLFFLSRLFLPFGTFWNGWIFSFPYFLLLL